MEAIILSIIVFLALVFCLQPVVKEYIVKKTLRDTDLFKALEDAMSYEEVYEVLGEEPISKKELKVGFHRRQLQYIWNFEEVDSKMYKLIVNFEQDVMVSKDIICE